MKIGFTVLELYIYIYIYTHRGVGRKRFK